MLQRCDPAIPEAIGAFGARTPVLYPLLPCVRQSQPAPRAPPLARGRGPLLLLPEPPQELPQLGPSRRLRALRRRRPLLCRPFSVARPRPVRQRAEGVRGRLRRVLQRPQRLRTARCPAQPGSYTIRGPNRACNRAAARAKRHGVGLRGRGCSARQQAVVHAVEPPQRRSEALGPAGRRRRLQKLPASNDNPRTISLSFIPFS